MGRMIFGGPLIRFGMMIRESNTSILLNGFKEPEPMGFIVSYKRIQNLSRELHYDRH